MFSFAGGCLQLLLRRRPSPGSNCICFLFVARRRMFTEPNQSHRIAWKTASLYTKTHGSTWSMRNANQLDTRNNNDDEKNSRGWQKNEIMLVMNFSAHTIVLSLVTRVCSIQPAPNRPPTHCCVRMNAIWSKCGVTGHLNWMNQSPSPSTWGDGIGFWKLGLILIECGRLPTTTSLPKPSPNNCLATY